MTLFPEPTGTRSMASYARRPTEKHAQMKTPRTRAGDSTTDDSRAVSTSARRPTETMGPRVTTTVAPRRACGQQESQSQRADLIGRDGRM